MYYVKEIELIIVNESEMNNRRYNIINLILLYGIIFALGQTACLLVLIIAYTVM